MSDWQPIETAPKDGRVVDLWVPDRGRVTDCAWHPDLSGWQRTSDQRKSEGVLVFVLGKPTHWMPRPNPPEGVKP